MVRNEWTVNETRVIAKHQYKLSIAHSLYPFATVVVAYRFIVCMVQAQSFYRS